MSKHLLPGILAMAATVVASNILVQYLLGPWLTWGALTYPIAFLVTDLTNRLHGAAAARKVVLVGFVAGVVFSLIGSQIMGEFAKGYSTIGNVSIIGGSGDDGASSVVGANGFSTNTWQPAASASQAMEACAAGGVAICTTSSFCSASMRESSV